MFAGDNELRAVAFGDSFYFKGDPDYYKPYLPPYAGDDSEVWAMRHDPTKYAFTSSELTLNGIVPEAGVWIRKAYEYTIEFTTREEDQTIGSMSDANPLVHEDYTLPKNKFIKYGYEFENWSVENVRTTYGDEDTIPADTYELNDVVTLVANFVKVDHSAEMKDGEFEITLRGGEMATFDNIPAGTAYQVYELTPEGWILVAQNNISGKIEPLIYAQADFKNKYQPDMTAAQFYGTKLLDNRAAEADSFYFELLDEEGTIIDTKPVSDGGFIVFRVIEYTKEDIGTHTYTVREIDPNDDTIDYDAHTETVTVTVSENENGTLTSKVEYDEDGIVFKNKTRPGVLKISKVGENVNERNKDDEFTFKVTLTNENGVPLGSDNDIYWYIEGETASTLLGKNAVSNAANAATDISDDKSGVSAGGMPKQLVGINAPSPLMVKGGNVEKEAFVATPDMLEGTAYAVMNDAGELIIFRSNETYTSGTGQTVTDIKGNTYTGRVFTNLESPRGGNPAWYSARTSIVSVRFAEGQALKPYTTYNWLYGATKLESVDLSGLDTSLVKNMNSMFGACSKLTTLDVSSLNTTNVTNLNNMFNSCSNLTSLNVSGIDTSSVTDFTSIFENCSKLTTLDVSGFSTSSAVKLDGMFAGCSGLTSIDVSNFNTSNVTSFYRMFSGCSGLTSLDVTNFDTSKATSISVMFAGCSGLTSIDVSNFNTSTVTAMHSLFNGCSGLTSIDVSKFDTSITRDFNSMFAGCSGLTSIDVSNLDTSNATNLMSMFSGCTNLKTLDVSNFDTSKCRGFSGMFRG